MLFLSDVGCNSESLLANFQQEKKEASEIYLKYILKKCISVPELLAFLNRNYHAYFVFITAAVECHKYREQYVSSQNYLFSPIPYLKNRAYLFLFVQEQVLDINLIYIVEMLVRSSNLENIVSILREFSEVLQRLSYWQHWFTFNQRIHLSSAKEEISAQYLKTCPSS